MWLVQLYRSGDVGPFFQGQVHDFEKVKAKIRENRSPDVIIRVIGPDDAPHDQIRELIELGATQTFSEPLGWQ
jgi:hypothetical protein